MKHLFQLSLLLLALLLPTTATAHDFEVDGIYYKINGNEATMTYRGNYPDQYSNEYSGSVTIPATVTYNGTTYSVTSIGNSAFHYCRGLTSITIPNSVTSIGNSAFSYCYGLTSITIPNSVTTIGNNAFYECSNLTSIEVAIGNPTYDSRDNCNAIIETASNTLILGCMNTAIPNSVTTIGYRAFYGCTCLASITIPNSVTSIGDNAFALCTALTSLTIPNSVTSIDGSAFNNCSGLTSIVVASGNPNYDSRNNCNAIIETASNTLIVGCQNTIIPNSVISIGEYAFDGCSGLTSITIPESVLTISEGSFSHCVGLTSITIPNSVTSIGEYAFRYCSSLASVIIGNSVTSIGDWAFSDCSGLTSVTIPNSVISIGEYAFFCCSGLTSVTVESGNPKYDSRNNCNAIIETDSNTLILGCMNTIIPNSVTSIGIYAFFECSSLTSITIPNSVTAIGDCAFTLCYSLTSITIPNSVSFIGYSAFEDCSSLTEIYCLALTPPMMYSSSFSGCYEATLYVPDIALGSYKATDYWKEFTNIVGMPYTFEVDGTSYHATTMNTANVMANSNEEILYTGDVVIPDTVTYEGYTFAVTGIESNAFDGCFELTSITIPSSVETIGEQAFQGCTGLTSVTIGSGVTAIGAKAFNYCNALETVKCIGTVPPVMASADCFSAAAYNRAQLLVPRNTEATYSATDYWYKFAHIDGWGSAGQGDVNGDGVMSITDVTSLIDVLLGHELDSFYFESADLNSNGRLDIGDVTSLIDNLLNGDY